jgi:RNA polymerase sigma-70 factor (sigma-E family)
VNLWQRSGSPSSQRIELAGGAVIAEVEGFAQFVAARERALQRTAWLLTGDWGLAEDLVQTALARSWPHWERIRRRDNPEVYVRRVMVNTWLTWSRRRWRGERASDAVQDSPAPGDMAADVAVRMAVRSALGSLTHRQRTVIVLRVFDDLPEAQVAEILNCSVGNVKSTASRALAKLRDDPQLAGLLDREAR